MMAANPMTTLFLNARILTLAGHDTPRRGRALRELGVIENGWVLIENDRIVDLGAGAAPAADDLFDCAGQVLMPAFVDCHTHACWAGSRLDEFEQKLAGATYLEILRAGGGIMSTVRAVRRASEDDLVRGLLARIARMVALGTGTIEIKSGYGLTTADELKMLRAIDRVAHASPLTIVKTFLGAHAKDADQPEFVDRMIDETLPAVVREFPRITVDAYCEEGAWSLDETHRLFESARSFDSPLRVHADQFHSLGGTRLAVEMEARSVDHLEATTPDDLQHLARSDVMGVVLPCSGFQLDDRYAPARAFIDAGGAMAMASNYNPGSAPTPSIPFTIALACRKLRMTPAEAISAVTINAAHVLRLDELVGSLEPGKRADLQVLDVRDERELGYEFAGPGPRLVMLGGRIMHRRGALTRRPSTR